jgi:YidC/Oxa1 family membrane protein insertase
MPIGLLPIIMGISMIVQTKLNPAPTDPMQAKLMMIMPVVFQCVLLFLSRRISALLGD